MLASIFNHTDSSNFEYSLPLKALNVMRAWPLGTSYSPPVVPPRLAD